MARSTSVSLVLGAVLAIVVVMSSADPGYLLSCVGDCQATGYPPQPTAPGLAMMGGHMYPPTPGVGGYQAFKWLASRAGNGSFVVLKCIQDPSEVPDCPTYNEFIYSFGTVRSVTTICFTNATAAQDMQVYTLIRQAGGIFFTGGDQWLYVSWWNNTLVSQALNELISLGRPFGGSSAGLAIQGEYVYTAARGSVTSAEALRFPFIPLITLTNAFLRFPFMTNVVTDTHFYQRDRMGRMVTFMGRILTSGWTSNVLGVGVSEDTAVLVDDNGIGTMVGKGPALFVRNQPQSKLTCEPHSPLTFTELSVFKFADGLSNHGAKFDFKSWTGSGGSTYTLSAVNGVLNSTQPGGSIY